MSALIDAELAATCSTLGGMHGGKYVVEPQCHESVRDIIRYLRRDDEYHAVRRYLGEAKILQTDLVHIVTASSNDLFDIVIRLLVNLTNPVLLLCKEEIPVEKVGRNIYLNLVGFSQEYKVAFCNVPFWTVLRSKLTELFEIDWAERSEDQSLQIERILVLLRNVLQVPADSDAERRPDNDITVHDKVLWALRESQLLELLLYISSNKDEDKYYLHLLEIFSLLLREQNPEVLASCEIRRSAAEKEQDMDELANLREIEKMNKRSFKNSRNFKPTFVLKNVKSISDNEMIYHKSLDKLYDLKLTHDKKRVKTPKNRFPVDSERPERRSTFSVRLFLKEFCVELLSCSFNNLMGTVKDKLESGRGLANDESYYFWALTFFLEFSCSANIDIKLISECINVQTFHFCQTQMENCYVNLATDKKKVTTWIKRLHLILKGYRALLHTLQWMDSSPDPKIRESGKVLKSNIFYVVEYREFVLSCLLKYDSGKFPVSFLRDLIKTNHLSLKLLEGFCKSSNIVVQKKKRVIKRRKKKNVSAVNERQLEAQLEFGWNAIMENMLNCLLGDKPFPEIPPFDAASDIPIDDQKEDAMRRVQKYLRDYDVRSAIGLLRSARQVWPENNRFGKSNMPADEEVLALQKIYYADLGAEHVVNNKEANNATEDMDDSEEGEDEDEEDVEVTERNFEIQDYVKRLVNKKVIEGCCILLRNYKKNNNDTNHCIAKLLHRIAWDCKSPAMLYQASLFVTLLKILREKEQRYEEIQQFAKFLVKKFRKNAMTNPKIFMELLFWKETKTAYEMEFGYGTNEENDKKVNWSEEEEDEIKRLWVEFDEKMLDVNKVDWIRDNLINQSRSRISIIKKLKDLMLIIPGAKVTKKRSGREWTEAELSQLTSLFEKFQEAIDPVEAIKERLPFSRSKKSIKDKLVSMGLVSNLSELRKKRIRKGKELAQEVENRDEEDDSDGEESGEELESGDPTNFEPKEIVVPFKISKHVIDSLKAVKHMTDALLWLKDTFADGLIDGSDDCYPLLAVNASQTSALENEDFQVLLRNLLLAEPNNDNIFWEIPSCSETELHTRIELVNAALNDNLDNLGDNEDEFDKLLSMMANAPSKVEFCEVPENVDCLVPSTSSAPLQCTPKMTPEILKSNRKKRWGVISSDESDTEVAPSEAVTIEPRPIDSDRSDRGDGSDNDGTVIHKKTIDHRLVCFASDSEGENSPPHSPRWNQKRRRCIGSDSEVEERPSDDEQVGRPFEVRKRSKMFDSDSDLEGQGSAD